MKSKHISIVALLMLLLPVFFSGETAAANSELITTYSGISPIIDGSLGAEWNDTSRHLVNLTGAADIETWVYLKHNGTYIYVGLLIWQYGSHTLDQCTIFFDEGDDGSYGSGTRDNILTAEQEDLKSCTYQQPLRDGFYNASAWRTFYDEIDFEANCTYEVDHSTSQDEIEYWEGLGWVDDHWEFEFAVPFIGNDGGISDGSDLNCTIADTLGFKIQWFTQPGANNYYYPAGTIYEINTFANLSFSPLPTIESCDIGGSKKDEFDLGEPVYINGSGYSPSTPYDFYVVNDTITWTDEMPIPARIPGTATTISSDALGNIPTTAIWADPQTIGAYDMVVDINGNGVYDANVDVLDNDDIMVTAGFVIPEFTSILPLLILATLMGIIASKKRRSL
jgi:hypothetical protein